MTLFFLITGFFARVLLHRYGTRAFAKDRLKRIVVPMVGGWVIFGLPTFAIAHWAGGTSPGPFVHLWFLYYLCIFYVLALTMRAAFNRLIDRHGRIRIAIDTAVRGVTSNYIAPIALASPLFVLLYFSDGWHEWWGIPTPQWHFRPEAFAMVGFGTAFAFGWFVHRQAELLRHWQATWHVHIAIAIGLTAVCLSMVGIAPMSKLTLSALEPCRICRVLHRCDLVLDIGPRRRGLVLLLAREPFATLRGGFIVLALSGACASRALSGFNVGRGAAALGGQIPVDLGDNAHCVAY